MTPSLQGRLGRDFGPRVQFLSITVDPARDTPAVLKRYAQQHGAQGTGWAFLRGTPCEIRAVAKHYGVYYRKTSRGDVDHTFLTSLVDQDGILRVQYLGVRFDPNELLRDLQTLMREGQRRGRTVLPGWDSGWPPLLTPSLPLRLFPSSHCCSQSYRVEFTCAPHVSGAPGRSLR